MKIIPKKITIKQILKRRIFTCLVFICFIANYSATNTYNNEAVLFKNIKLNTKTSKLKILTWNIRDLGRTKNNEEIRFIANVIKDYDIVALQEVVAKDRGGAQAIAKIVSELNRLGSKWDYSISNPTKSPSNYISERYAYIWKTSKLRLKNKPFLDVTLENVIEREPYIAKFEIKKYKTSFYFINIHARVYNRHPEMEIKHFKNYPKRLQTDNIIFLGDFNLNEKHTVWNPLYKKGFKPAIKNTATTLKRACKNGVYTNHAIDNIYYNSGIVQFESSGIVDFILQCNNLTKARMISDHLPVFLEMSLIN